eukprot:5686327-Amphidinium_carterae.2
MGPARQTETIPLEELAGQKWEPIGKTKDGPIGAYNMIVIASFHMLREIEVACLLASRLVIDKGSKRESLHLAVSKTDPYAYGCWRSWSCVCTSGSTDLTSRLCPFHAAQNQEALLSD